MPEDYKKRNLFIRLVEVDSALRANILAEPIQYLEGVLSDLPRATSNKKMLLSTQLATLILLAENYARSGHAQAALEASRQAEIVFLRLLDWSSENIDHNHYDMVMSAYLLAGKPDEARRFAKRLAFRLSQKNHPGKQYDARQFEIRLYQRLSNLINEHVRTGNRRAAQMRLLRIDTENHREKPTDGLSLTVLAYHELIADIAQAS